MYYILSMISLVAIVVCPSVNYIVLSEETISQIAEPEILTRHLVQAYVIAFSFGMGAIPWVIMSEVSFICILSLCSTIAHKMVLVCHRHIQRNHTLGRLILYLQILPVSIKSLAGSFATLANWLTSFGITMTANLLLSWSAGGSHPCAEFPSSDRKSVV